MPREHRKRGKRNKKKSAEDEGEYQEDFRPEQEPTSLGELSWIRSAEHEPTEISPEAPFGFVDADIKAYFRTVDIQIRDWQDNRLENVESEDIDPNEQRRLFFVAALVEMDGRELRLATDPECSVILERMIFSMDDFVRRVFMSNLVGSFEHLVRHRFGSHVCQTLFTVAKETASREARSIFPTIPESFGKRDLRTLTQLILDISEELLPVFSSLILDPFASHVLRALLLLLAPIQEGNSNDSLRSKKSATWRARQGQMKSLFLDEKGNGKGKEWPSRSTPLEFRQLARRFVEIVQTELGDNEVRAIATNRVASPVLQILLEVEADHDMTNVSESLMDRVTVGIISACRKDPEPDLEPADYLNALLRDPTSSHLLETVMSQAPETAFNTIWSIYFKGTLSRLAVHPVANFVVAKALGRVSVEQLSEACCELAGSWSRIIRSSRPGVLRAAIDRSATLQACQSEIGEAVFSAFEILTPEDHSLLVPSVLCLLPSQEYKVALTACGITAVPKEDRGQTGKMKSALQPTVQGSILLQSLLRLADPYNKIVIASIMSLSIQERIKLAHDTNSSRIYDVLLESSTVPLKAKRQFVMDFIGHYHTLVDDRLGSRIGDRCWSFADTFLKEKIARSLIIQDHFLASSFYGKFFARNLNLYLLQRRPDEWRTTQADRKRLQDGSSKPVAPASIPTSASSLPLKTAKRKRESRAEDEIDALFNESLGRKVKMAALSDDNKPTQAENPKGEDGVQEVLAAIKVVPKEHGTRRRK